MWQCAVKRAPQFYARFNSSSQPITLRNAKAGLGANHKHGLRRSNGDKRRSVEMALAEFGHLSDRLLAELCGVSVPTIGNIRHQLSIFDGSPRMGKDGKLRALPVRGINGSARPEVLDDGPSDVIDGGGAFMDVADMLTSVEERFENLVRDHPDQTAAVLALISKVRSDLLQLQNRLQGAKR